ncbi:dipeptide ABC transporter ATP-binding protein [Hansschlegelia sp. KR7-227]|uniref:dipeptide ABC transporter ATP-binding protein n=1 Tax=Hansschlegelia sp. KR7-227 TaxID=3400914 RepID=UPI003C126A48
MSAPALVIRDLTVELPSGSDRARGVDGLSLEVARGELLCLVGESGSGKSMTALAAMGLLSRDLRASGSIRVEGEEILGAPEPRLGTLRGLRMAMAFQEPMTALNPVMTCGDQIGEVFRAHGGVRRAERRRRVLAALSDVGVVDALRIAASYPHQLSGGQRQRVVLAIALALKPALLIADEPTTALDVTTQAQILSLIRTVQRERGMAVLFVTHDFGVAHDIADRVAVLKDGRLVEAGAARALLARPSHPYTRALMAAIPSLSPPPAEPDAREGALLLRVDGLSKTYRRARLFRRSATVVGADAVSFALRRGETLGLVGESGSGKSTVARCVARLLDGDAGRILLEGEDVAKLRGRLLKPFRRRVQIVFQDPYRSLDPRRTIAEALAEGPLNFGATRSAARAGAAELLELVRIDPASLDRYPRQFSGGQRQRICIARALAMRPDLIIADEATSALDVLVQAEILKLLQGLRVQFGLAMLFITHDLRVAAQLCDAVAVMRDGRIVEAGRVRQVFAAPQHPYTAALIAAAPGLETAGARPRGRAILS